MNKKDIIRGILVLIIITALAGYLLAFTYEKTKPAIEKQQKEEGNRIDREIFPEGVNFVEIKENGVNYSTVLDAEGKEIGKSFTIISYGYGGEIKIKVGVDENLKIKGVKILQHNETPGLGAKITDEKFLSQFKEKGYNQIYLKKDNPEGEIDSITGATISSRAVTDGIRKLFEQMEIK